jgi:[protein-PII] uridylyltransferase
MKNQTVNLQAKFKKVIESNLNYPARLVCNQLTYLMDTTLIQLFEDLPKKEHFQKKFCIIAIGGYGRMELAPHSDIDILYLHDHLSEEDLNILINHFNNFLYNNGKEVGYACRTIQESREYLDNLHSFNAILDSRFLLGSRKLYEEFEIKVLNDLPIDLITEFSNLKIKHLQALVDSNPPLHISEPNLKNGPLGLRDIQTIYWMEKSIRVLPTITSLSILPVFNRGEVHLLENAYEFYLKLRNALHVLNSRKVDTLSIPMQPLVAEFLGFGKQHDIAGIDSMMREFYKHENQIYHFIRMYLDYRKINKAVFETINCDGTILRLYQNSLYPDRLRTIFTDLKTLSRDILQVFYFSQKENLDLSPILINEIQFASNFLDDTFHSSSSSIKIFREILRFKKGIGNILTEMHRSNILEKILPEFGTCKNYSLFSYHHNYTIDEHTLLILRELDKLIDGVFELDDVQKVFNTCSNIDILALAILIHDAGKVKDGDHCQYGAELALNIGERFGLSEYESSLLKFLVEWHIVLSEISSKRDTSDPHILHSLIQIVEDQSRLSLLYILTIIDTKSVGKTTLTNWKRVIIKNLYEKTFELMNTELISNKVIFSKERNFEVLKEYLIEKESFDEVQSTIVLQFAKDMKPDSYISYFTPRRVLDHFLDYIKFSQKDSLQININYSFEPAYVNITISHNNGKLFLAEISGCATSCGMSVIGLRTFRNVNGYIIEILQVTELPRSSKITPKKVETFSKNLEKLFFNEIIVEDLLNSPLEWYNYNQIPEGMVEEKIDFDNEISLESTVLEVRLPDTPGLLYRLLKTILSFDLELHFVKVSTSADYAFDSFYLQEKSGSKIYDPEKLFSIKAGLKDATKEKFQTNISYISI